MQLIYATNAIVAGEGLTPLVDRLARELRPDLIAGAVNAAGRCMRHTESKWRNGAQKRLSPPRQNTLVSVRGTDNSKLIFANFCCWG
jgi:hypothetical protein